jgi:hypothetical protein
MIMETKAYILRIDVTPSDDFDLHNVRHSPSSKHLSSSNVSLLTTHLPSPMGALVGRGGRPAMAAAAAAPDAEKKAAKKRQGARAEQRWKGAILARAVLLVLAGLSVRDMMLSAFEPTALFSKQGLQLEVAADRDTLGRSMTPLESLYEGTSNGTQLHFWLRSHVRTIYPHFSSDDEVQLGSPSLVQDKTSTVLSVMVRPNSADLKNLIFLMLCNVRAPLGETRCQDSGFQHSTVPPECDGRYWLDPQLSVMYSSLTLVGPADPRLFLDEDGNLGATAVMRGCHPRSRFGNHTPIHSVYVLSWTKDTGTHDGNGDHDTGDAGRIWRVAGRPKLLDLRSANNSYLGDDYPPITKSWISLPGPFGHPSPANAQNYRFSVGFTRRMWQNVVYRVVDAGETLYSVVPANEQITHSRAALRKYRASTNLVRFRGGLLGMGHRRYDTKVPYYYLHYWYVTCPRAPYRAVACSDEFRLNPDDPASRVNFALGLAVDEPAGGSGGDSTNASLYLAWSEADRVPYLRRYAPEDVLATLRSSTLARSAAGLSAGKNASDFADLCRIVDDRGKSGGR